MWHGKCARRFPWRNTKDPFHLLLAEIMLQQTDSQKVWHVYEKFIDKFPNIESLAVASLGDLRNLLKSLGLFYRAKRLRDIALTIVEKHRGILPQSTAELRRLPGVGNYVAAATVCFAFGRRALLVDVNFARVYSRFFGIHLRQTRPHRDRGLLNFASSVLPAKKAVNFNYAVLDFASTICTKRNPKCRCCPLKSNCSNAEPARNGILLGVDLFAGAGGLSLGAISAGVHMAYAIEADYKAAVTYEYNNSKTAVAKQQLSPGNVRSVCKTLGISPKSIDVVVAGPPCQGFSIANLRTRNDSNPNNHAWKTVISFVRYVQPKGVVIENVGGIATYRNGKTIKLICKEFNKLGYYSKTYHLDAIDFGVPQHRRRVFIMASRINSLEGSISTRNAKPISVRQALQDLPLLSNGNVIEHLPYRLNGAVLSKYQSSMRKNKRYFVGNCKTTHNTDLIIRRFETVPQGGNWQDIPEELFQTYTRPENCHRWLYRRLDEHQPSVTINNFRKNMLIHPWQNRTLTVREAARLQGIHDGFVFLGNLHSQQQQVANAVPPQMAQAVTKTLLDNLKGEIYA